MNYWSMLLHFYQPPTQTLKITREVLASCYLPTLTTLESNPHVHVTCNISGSLIDKLEEIDAREFFERMARCIACGQVELVTSTKFHPLSPLISSSALIRQTQKNTQAIRSHWPDTPLRGFFPPELAISAQAIEQIQSEYIMIDQTALSPHNAHEYEPIVSYKEKLLLINNHAVCHLLRAYPRELRSAQVLAELARQVRPGALLVSANDAELFGHHYAHRQSLLQELFAHENLRFITASEAIDRFGASTPSYTHIRPSTWDECTDFDLWNTTSLQRQYLALVAEVERAFGGRAEAEVLELFDRSNSSCYLYWLSNWPWWHPDLVESGARLLIAAVRRSAIPKELKSLIESRYYSFLSAVWKYHWSGEVEKQYLRFDAHKQNAMQFCQ